MKIFLGFLFTCTSFSSLFSGCCNCQNTSTSALTNETPQLKRLRELHALRKDTTALFKKRLQQLHELRHPPKQKPITSTINVESIEDESPTGTHAIFALDNQERATLTKISQVLTPLIIAYPQDTLIPKATVTPDIEFEYLQTINLFLLKLKTAYEKLPTSVQSYFKTKQFTKHSIGSTFTTLINTVKNYVNNKQSSYKAIKSPDTLVKELKKLANSLEKIINWWDTVLYQNISNSNSQ